MVTLVDFFNRALLSDQERPHLVASKKAPKTLILVARFALHGASQPTPEHRQSAEDVRLLLHSVDRAGNHEQKARSHEILPEAVAQTTGVDALLA